MEPFAQAVLEELKAINSEARKAIEGLGDEALNWRPAGAETNPLYVIITHMAGAQRSAVANAVGRTVERDRPAEFASKGENIAPLLAALDRAEADIGGWLGTMTPEDLAKLRPLMGREAPAARCLAFTLRHLGEHLGHASLTRQLLDQRG